VPGLRSLRRIPTGIWALGFVSLFMDVSSEMIHALLPVYLVVVLGASTLTVGIIEGIAEATASITKIFSGALSDRLGKRKLLAVLGYGMAALTKPVFPLAPTVGWLVAARFVDRIGKGVRGAPRDALVADIAPADLRGAAFGLRQSLDTAGAFLGPGLAILLMLATGDDFRLVFWVAVIPAFVAVLVLLLGVREPERAARTGPAASPFSRTALAMLGRPFWLVTGLAAVIALARFSEAFLILRAQGLGLAPALVPLVLVGMNVAYALSSYPAGALADRIDRRLVLAAGLIVLILADLVLAAAGGLVMAGIGTALWGLHMGLSQGLIATLVADTAPVELRGTAFGMLNLTGGIATLLASVLAGALWDLSGPAATFLAGAGLTLVALLGLIVPRRVQPESARPAVPNGDA
jgi:MFS family permease